MKIILISSNKNKLRELSQVLPARLAVELHPLDLDEIQSLDVHEIITHKLHQAYDIIKCPVIVEDVSAELDNLSGLPGPFIKFFEQQLGRGSLYKLSSEGTPVTIRCVMGYYDGSVEHIVEGVLHGKIVAPRGENGFGFDCVIVADGYDATLAELTDEEKNTMSHRHHAAVQMAKFIETL